VLLQYISAFADWLPMSASVGSIGLAMSYSWCSTSNGDTLAVGFPTLMARAFIVKVNRLFRF
jgi:hypothetical protein